MSLMRHWGLVWCLGTGLAGLSVGAAADPWIAPGDAELRHHIEVLADAHVITVPITTWPLMWSGIAKDIQAADTTDLTPAEMSSLAYVRAAYRRLVHADVQVDARVDVAGSTAGIRTFSESRRERDEASAGISWTGYALAGRLQATAVDDPVDGKKYRPDGSYVAGILGNWSLSAGWVDRWWGPGWQSSLILSDNARPVPAVTLQRNNSDAFKTPWLSWIGPWQFVTFAGELESNDRVTIPAAKLLGARLTLKPLPSFELGFSRTAQWGGRGRPEGLRSLFDVVVGRDNNGSGGITTKNDPSNQEAGYDARWSFHAGNTSDALYGQMIGEDNAGGLPSRFFYLAGAETAFATQGWQHRLALEASQTDANGFGKNIYYDYVYEHYLYTQGYRYLGRPLGASFDNDSRVMALQGNHFWGEGRQIAWVLGMLNLNMDGHNVPLPGGNVFGPNHTKTSYASLSYGFPLSQRLRMTLGGEYYRHALRLDDVQAIRSDVFGRLEFAL